MLELQVIGTVLAVDVVVVVGVAVVVRRALRQRFAGLGMAAKR